MITTGLSPLGISWSFLIDNVSFDRNKVQRINVSYVDAQHDLATIEVVGIPTDYLMSYIDRPMFLSMNLKGGQACYFYGYVSHIEAMSNTNEGLVNSTPFQLVKLTCFGTSYSLRFNKTKVWNNVKLSDIVSSIAQTSRFGYSIPNNSYTFKRIVQSEESSWKFLNKVSNHLGYTVTLSNGHIHIWDKTKSAARQTSYNELVGSKVLLKNPKPQPGAIISFNPLLGSTTPYGNTDNTSISYMDNQGVLVKVTKNDLGLLSSFGQNNTNNNTNSLSVNVNSFDVARSVLIARENQNYPHACEVTIMGDPSIKLGGLVKIVGYEGNFDGFWYVDKVSHELYSESLTTYLRLTKDGNSKKLPKFPVVQQYKEPQQPILINNLWVFKSEYTNVYN